MIKKSDFLKCCDAIKSDLLEGLSDRLSFLNLEPNERKKFISQKSDRTPVTEIDLYVSDLVKSKKDNFESLKPIHFLSEEDQESFGFPSLILDPIDGTKELILGVNECALSMAVMTDEKWNGYGWIYNPFNHFEISSGREARMITPNDYANRTLIGLLSRSEYKDGFGRTEIKGLALKPVGSIAYKLALCASGAADFVVSFRPKNIWDIAAGTIMLKERGFLLYENGKIVEFAENRRYQPPLIWSLPENYEFIARSLSEV